MSFGGRSRLVLYGLLVLAFILMPLTPPSLPPQRQAPAQNPTPVLLPSLPARFTYSGFWTMIQKWLSTIANSGWHEFQKYVGSFTERIDHFELLPVVHASQTITSRSGTICVLNPSWNSGSSFTVNAIGGNAPNAGEAMMLAFAYTGTSLRTVNSITDGLNTWVQAVANSNGNVDSEIWYALNITGGNTTITLHMSGSLPSNSIGAAAMCEYDNVKTSGALDQTAVNSGTSNSPDTGTTSTTTLGSELWFGALASDTKGSCSPRINNPSNGFSDINGSVNLSCLLADAALEKIVSATGTADTTSASTGCSSCVWSGTIATFEAAPSANSSTLSDGLTNTESVTGATNHPQLTETLKLTDSLRKSSGLTKFIDVLSLVDVISRLRNVPKSMSDPLTLTDVVASLFIGSRSISQPLTLTDTVKLRSGRTFVDALTLLDLLTMRASNVAFALTENINLSDVLIKGQPATVADILNQSDFIGTTFGRIRQLTDTFTSIDTLMLRLGKIISDSLNLSDRITIEAPHVLLTLTDTVRMVDVLTHGTPKKSTEAITILDLLTHSVGKTPSDILGIADSLLFHFKGARFLSDNTMLVEFLSGQRNIPIALSDLLTLIENLSVIGPPRAPTTVTAAANSQTPTSAVDVSWTDTYGDYTGFYVERSTDQITWTQAGSSQTLSFTDTGLSSGFGYYYRVRAYNSISQPTPPTTTCTSNCSAYSAVSNVAITSPPNSGLGGGGGGGSGTPPPPTPSYALVIQITDLNGTPLQSATVSQGTQSLLTDTQGLADFKSQTSGSYTITAAASGCTGTNETINLSSDHSSSNPLVMKLACGTQQQANISGNQPTLPQTEQLIALLVGLSLLGISTLAIIQNRKRGKPKKKKEAFSYG